MAGRFQGTEVFEAPERRDPREARRRRRGPRGGTVFIWLLVLAVIGVGLAFGLRIVDQTVRGVAEDQAEKQIADQARRHGIGEDEVIEKIMLTPVAIKRLVEPDEVAELAAVLYGPASASITGASLTLDGGWTAH